MISGFLCEVGEKYTLLGYYAVLSTITKLYIVGIITTTPTTTTTTMPVPHCQIWSMQFLLKIYYF